MNRPGSMNRLSRLIRGRSMNGRAGVIEKVCAQSMGWGGISSVAALFLLLSGFVQAAPDGGQVVSGPGSISQSGATTTVTQSAQNLSLSWKSFNIAPQEVVNFVQPSATAIAVNRISDTNATQILGHLNANGQVYLINPNGILFGQGAQVNVGGLVASTLDLNDAGLNGTNKSFSGNGSGSIVNQGTIHAADGGSVALLGNRVGNRGVITAQLGTVALGAGSAATLTFNGNRLVHMQVDKSVLNSLAENHGLIQADGGMVAMTAGAEHELLASVVNNTGVIEARTVENHNGTITLLGGMEAGTVTVGGTFDASAPYGGKGGFIETSAAHVKVANNAKVTTASSTGKYGAWLIDPKDYTVAASGGDITGAQLSSNLQTTPVILQSSGGSGSGAGNMNVNDGVSWSANTTLTLTASNNVNVRANIAATGNTAGLVLNPNTTNGAESASGMGTFNLLNGASISLPGTNPSLSIAGTAYTVINNLGVATDASVLPATLTLQGIASASLAGHYALGSTIDATATSAWNGGTGFTSIGSVAFPFTGVFDGLGHTITGLTINQPATADVGLFGSTGTASIIRNVGLIGGSITGLSSAGGLVGSNTGTIRNSYNTGSVSGGSSLGGLMGSNTGTVSDSHATGNINGTSSLGGLMGSNTGTVSGSYATGNVSGTSSLGGLMGSSTTGLVSNSFATGNVNGTSSVGGLMGSSTGPVSDTYATGSVTGTTSAGGLMGSSTGPVTNSYATGAVSGTTSVGALMGSSSGPVTSSYWNTETSGQIASPGGTGLTSAQMQQQTNFNAWDFANTWVIYNGFTNPLLRSFMTPITVTANNAVKTYDRLAFSGGNGVSYSTTPIGNPLGTISYGGTSQGAVNAGGYVITVVPQAGLFSTQLGYLFSYVSGTLTVNQASLAITGITASNKVYDATRSASLNGTAVVTAISGDDVSVSGTGAGLFADKNVGTAKSVIISGYTLGGFDAANYSAIQPTGVSANITAANLLVTGISASNKVYNTTRAASLGGTASVSALGGDDVSVSGTGSGLFDTKNVGTAKAITVTGYLLGGNDAGNYTVVQPASVSANITAASLAITGITASNKIYDATRTASLTGIATVAALGSDDVFVSGTGSGLFANKNVGTAKGITVSGYLLGGSDAANYTATQPTSVSANITAASVAVTGITAANKVYDTTRTAALNGTAAVAALGSDDLSVSGTGSGLFDTKNVGTAKSITVSGYLLSGTDAGNYTVTQPTGVSANITTASLAITGVTASNKVYDATRTASLGGTATVAALGSDDVTVSGSGSGLFDTKNVGTGKSVTVTGYLLGGADAANYAVIQPSSLFADITAAIIPPPAVTPPESVPLNATSQLEFKPVICRARRVPELKRPACSPTITKLDSMLKMVNGGMRPPGAMVTVDD